jgi:hypothetical protein
MMKDRLEVNVEFVPRKLNGEIKLGLSDLWVNAHLTDEGLVVDVWRKDHLGDGVDECIASGYEFFSEAGLEPPKQLEIEDDKTT